MPIRALAPCCVARRHALECKSNHFVQSTSSCPKTRLVLPEAKMPRLGREHGPGESARRELQKRGKPSHDSRRGWPTRRASARRLPFKLLLPPHLISEVYLMPEAQNWGGGGEYRRVSACRRVLTTRYRSGDHCDTCARWQHSYKDLCLQG